MTIDENINFDTLIPFFDKYRIFTKDEMEHFMNKLISKANKVTNLIMWIEAKDESGICNFVKALNEAHKHSGHIAILKQLYNTAFSETAYTETVV